MRPLNVVISTVALTLIAGGLIPASAMAQQLSPADKVFATKAASGGQAEVTLGRIAAKNAQNPQVRQFGERMVTDHTQANDELMTIAKQESITLPTTPDSKDRSAAERLSNMKGQLFDTNYVRDMVQDHQEDVADFQKEATTGQDPALKAFAQKYLPILQQHLQMAQSLQSAK